jgi:hypothetical protein
VLKRAEAENKPIQGVEESWNVPLGILCMLAGCFAVYSALFSLGYLIYARYVPALILGLVAMMATIFLIRTWSRLFQSA